MNHPTLHKRRQHYFSSGRTGHNTDNLSYGNLQEHITIESSVYLKSSSSSSACFCFVQSHRFDPAQLLQVWRHTNPVSTCVRLLVWRQAGITFLIKKVILAWRHINILQVTKRKGKVMSLERRLEGTTRRGYWENSGSRAQCR